MTAVATVLTALVALIHVYIVVLEMALWDTPRGRAAFGTTPELADPDQGARREPGPVQRLPRRGLVLALVGPEEHRFAFAVFTLSCVVVAGLYGAVTASRRILWVQALPAALALVAQALLAH